MKHLYTTILCLLLLAPFGTTVLAQLKQPARLELEMREEDEEFYVVPAGHDGVFVHQQDRKETNYTKTVHTLYMYDTTLNERWKSRLEIGARVTYRGYEYANGNVFLLFTETRNRTEDYHLFVIDAETSFIRGYKIQNEMPLELTEFTVLEGLVLVGGYVNYRPAVFAYDLSKEVLRVLPGLYLNNSELLELKVSPEQKTFTVLYTDQTPDKQKTIGSKTYNELGELVFEYRLKPERDKYLLYGRTTSFDDEAVHIAGTYSNSNSKYSRGVFVASIATDGSQRINYYDYGELQNFFSYMKDKRQKRVQERIKRRMAQGKKAKFNYRLLVHDVIENNGNHILLAEAFYPKYANRPASPYFDSSRPSAYQGQYLEGYKYTHAIMVGFDTKGKLLWDNSFEISEVTTYQLDKLVHVQPEQDYTVLLYSFEGAVKSKIIRNDRVLEDKNEEKIALQNSTDQVPNPEYGTTKLESWYGPYFFAYGTQRIRTSGSPALRQGRKVFYINKIVYQADEALLENARSDAR
ncbi:hypothetical protein [Cesiribacter andamanensis]|nr:hypothetical protein [Cesiribacter andamanensis]